MVSATLGQVLACQRVAVTGKDSELQADAVEGFLVGENGVMVLFVLILVQVLRIKISRAGAGQIKERRLTWVVRDLEV